MGRAKFSGCPMVSLVVDQARDLGLAFEIETHRAKHYWIKLVAPDGRKHAEPISRSAGPAASRIPGP